MRSANPRHPGESRDLPEIFGSVPEISASAGMTISGLLRQSNTSANKKPRVDGHDPGFKHCATGRRASPWRRLQHQIGLAAVDRGTDWLSGGGRGG
jgi:hypothetical protein